MGEEQAVIIEKPIQALSNGTATKLCSTLLMSSRLIIYSITSMKLEIANQYFTKFRVCPF